MSINKCKQTFKVLSTERRGESQAYFAFYNYGPRIGTP